MVQSATLIKKKKENKIFKMIAPENFLKFYDEKNSTKNSLSFQLTNISGELPKFKPRKI